MNPPSTGYWTYLIVMGALFVGFGLAIAILAGIAVAKAPTRRHRFAPLGTAVAYFVGGAVFIAALLAFPNWYASSFAFRFWPAALGAIAFVVALGCLIAYVMPTAGDRRAVYQSMAVIGALSLGLLAACAAVPAWWNVFFFGPYLVTLVLVALLLNRREKAARQTARAQSPGP